MRAIAALQIWDLAIDLVERASAPAEQRTEALRAVTCALHAYSTW